MKNFVKIIAIGEEREDKNGRTYKNISVRSSGITEFVDESTGEVLQVYSKPKTTTIRAYEKQYLDNLPHYLYDVPVGANVMGNIERRNVVPYEINTAEGPKIVNRYTTFIEASQEDPDYEEIVAKAFENAGHELIAKRVKLEDDASASSDEDQVENAEEEESETKVPVVSYGDDEDIEDDF